MEDTTVFICAYKYSVFHIRKTPLHIKDFELFSCADVCGSFASFFRNIHIRKTPLDIEGFGFSPVWMCRAQPKSARPSALRTLISYKVHGGRFLDLLSPHLIARMFTGLAIMSNMDTFKHKWVDVHAWICIGIHGLMCMRGYV